SGTPDAAAREDPPAFHTPDAPEAPPGPRADVARAARQVQRLTQYERARALRDESYTWAVVAQQVGVPPRTLRYGFARAGFPARKRRTGDRSRLAPYREYPGSAGRPGSTVRHSSGTSCAPRASVGGTGAWLVYWSPGGNASWVANAAQRRQR